VGFFVLGDEPIKEVKHQKKKIVKVIPLKLIIYINLVSLSMTEVLGGGVYDGSFGGWGKGEVSEATDDFVSLSIEVLKPRFHLSVC